jgi:hypothetical protein
MVKKNASVEELLAFTQQQLKDFDDFAFGVFGSQIWKVLQRSRNDRSLNEVHEVMKDVLGASQPLLKSFEARSLVGLFYGCAKLQMRAEDFPRGWLEDWGTAFCGCVGKILSIKRANLSHHFSREGFPETIRQIRRFETQNTDGVGSVGQILRLKRATRSQQVSRNGFPAPLPAI